jgi:hypothetical protein
MAKHKLAIRLGIYLLIVGILSACQPKTDDSSLSDERIRELQEKIRDFENLSTLTFEDCQDLSQAYGENNEILLPRLNESMTSQHPLEIQCAQTLHYSADNQVREDSPIALLYRDNLVLSDEVIEIFNKVDPWPEEQYRNYLDSESGKNEKELIEEAVGNISEDSISSITRADCWLILGAYRQATNFRSMQFIVGGSPEGGILGEVCSGEFSR